MTATLHCFGESGHSYKVALAMTLAGRPWAPRFVDFFGGETRSPAFRALNVMGECPVLEEEDGTVLTQSGAILARLAQQTGRLGGSAGAQDEVLRWVLWDNHKLSGQVGALRFMMNFLPEARRDPAVTAWLSARVRAALQVLEAHLQGRDWVAGSAVSIADCSCCSYLYYPEPFGFDRKDWPNIDGWLGRIAALPGWKHPYDMMPGRPADRARGDQP